MSSQNDVFRPLGDDRQFFSEFSTHQPPNALYQKPDRRPPQITGRRVSALYTKGGSEPLTSSPCSEFTTLSLIVSNEVCGGNEITPRPIQDLLENYQADVGRDHRKKPFFSEFWKVKKK